MIKKIIIHLIKLYQLAISPFLGQNCRFEPTCSQYTIEAFTHFNIIKASYLSLKRIFKCHPFHPGGLDPLPLEAAHNQSKNRDFQDDLDQK